MRRHVTLWRAAPCPYRPSPSRGAGRAAYRTAGVDLTGMTPRSPPVTARVYSAPEVRTPTLALLHAGQTAHSSSAPARPRSLCTQRPRPPGRPAVCSTRTGSRFPPSELGSHPVTPGLAGARTRRPYLCPRQRFWWWVTRGLSPLCEDFSSFFWFSAVELQGEERREGTEGEQ